MINIKKLWLVVMMLILSVVDVFADSVITVTQVADNTFSLFFLVVIIIFMYILAIFTKQQIIGVLASIGLLIYSLSLFEINLAIGIILLACSLIITLYFVFVEW